MSDERADELPELLRLMMGDVPLGSKPYTHTFTPDGSVVACDPAIVDEYRQVLDRWLFGLAARGVVDELHGLAEQLRSASSWSRVFDLAQALDGRADALEIMLGRVR